MVEAMLKHNIQWLAPSPLWITGDARIADKRNGSMKRPAILRFQNDLFMDEFLALTTYQPERLIEWVAGPETWREPLPTPPTAAKLKIVDPISARSRRITQAIKMLKGSGSSTVTPSPPPDEIGNPNLPFKLYQPAQQRFYLVCATLACFQPGLPDRKVDPGKAEQVGFVIRRLAVKEAEAGKTVVPDPDTRKEYAFVNSDKGYIWKEVPEAECMDIQTEEERLPLFPVNFDEAGYRRRLLAGLIPVGKREAYLTAPKEPLNGTTGQTAPDTAAPDPRRTLFETDVIAPWKALVEQALATNENLQQDLSIPDVNPAGEDNNVKEKIRTSARNQIQTASWYILLDFADDLQQYLPGVWEAILDPTKKGGLDQEKTIFLDKLGTVKITFPITNLTNDEYTDTDIEIYLIEALKKIKANTTIGDNLERVVTPYDRESKPDSETAGWPDFLFPFADPGVGNPIDDGSPVPDTIIQEWSDQSMSPQERALEQIGALADLFEAALDPPVKPLPEVEAANRSWEAGDTWFVIRCVYERPNCGPLHPAQVSNPTAAFQMASFFDPDAPARPVRIPMPIDISPAGLRKFRKNGTFMISDMLCGKIKGIRKMTLGDLVLSVLPWPFHKDLPDIGTESCNQGSGKNIGMLCSLSIPIVTLCALILLIIIVSLFDMIFKWLPYLFICFPIPGLKGKKND